MAPLRWGIVSAGKISHDFTTAVSTWPKEDHKVVAVGARNLQDAKKFAKVHDIPKFYEGYMEMAKDPEIGEYDRCITRNGWVNKFRD